jgi:hypothetical protein
MSTNLFVDEEVAEGTEDTERRERRNGDVSLQWAPCTLPWNDAGRDFAGR